MKSYDLDKSGGRQKRLRHKSYLLAGHFRRPLKVVEIFFCRETDKPVRHSVRLVARQGAKMKWKRSPLLFLIILCYSSYSHAQAWSGIIDSSRAIDWSRAGTTIKNRTTICATLSPGASASQISSAISSCPANQVVFLNAGTYNLSGGINFGGHNNVTLRGAGPIQTVLQFSSGDGCGGQGGDICVIDSSPAYVGSSQIQPGGSNAHRWTAGYAKGATQITLDSTSGLSVGSVIILDQANDTSDTGGIFVCDTSPCHQGGETSSSNGRSIGGVDYNQTQIVTVTGISGNALTISPALFMNNWRASQSPGVWWTSQITGVGIEDLTVDNSGSGGSVHAGIYFYDANNSWVKNVKSLRGNRNHVWLYQSSHNVIRDSYFFGTQNGAQESYGVESFIASDNLIENNIFEQIASPIMSSGSSGNIYGYNFSTNNLYNVSVNWMQNSYANHDAGNLMNLYEGNSFNAIDCDDIHGTGGSTTYFRNQLLGAQPGKSLNTHAMNIYSYCRGYNVVGNVLGTATYHTNYEASPQTSSGSCDTSIYILGFPSSECRSGSAPPDDALVRSTLLRWGNYDTVSNAVLWNASEVPTAGVPFINGNPVPSSHTLPSSFYLTSKPSFWGAMPWPAFGPDVTGGQDSSGHAFMPPPQVCYNNTAKDGNGILLFNSNSCFSTQAAPAPPTNLRVTVN
jgi:hypothetical protein